MNNIRGNVIVTVRLNLRKSAPYKLAEYAGTVEVGTKLTVIGLVKGEEIKGNCEWYVGENNLYFWSGGTGAFQPEMDIPVIRRPNGTIKPLKDMQIKDFFGEFSHTESNGGRIKISKSWMADNITVFTHPILKKIDAGDCRIHTKAHTAFSNVFNTKVSELNKWLKYLIYK